jgi:DNA-binding NarL/FixJ family response regulator
MRSANGRRFAVGRGVEMLEHVPYLALRQAFGDLPPFGEAAEMVAFLHRAHAESVFVVDDLHWCDADTLAVLNELCVLRPVVATVRADPGPAAALVERFGEVGAVVDLAPLDAAAAGELVSELSPGALPSDVERWIAAAAGNPLMLELLATTPAAVAETGPRAVALAAVGALDADALQAAARLALTGRPLVVPDRARTALLAARLIDELPDAQVALRHDLVGEAAVELLGDERRRALHLELSGAAPDAATRAHHLVAAARTAEAVTVARAAAADAPTAWSRASLLLLAARHSSPGPDAQLAVEAAEQLSLAGRYREVAAVLEGVPVTDDALALRRGTALARALWAETDLEAARVVIDETLVLAERSGAVEEIELLSLRSRVASRLDWDLPAAIEIGRRAVAIADERSAGEIAAHSALGLALLMTNDAGWQEHLERAGRLAQANDDMHNAVVTFDALLFGHLLSGDAARARPIAEDMVRLTEDSSPAWNRYFRASALLAALHVDGDYTTVLEQGRRLLDFPLTKRAREMLTGVVALALADTGDDEPALALARKGVEAASDDGARSTATWALAETHWLAGRREAIVASNAAFDLAVGGYPGRVNAVLIGQWARRDEGTPCDTRARDVVALAFPNLAGAAAELRGLEAEDPDRACVEFEHAAQLWARSSVRAATRARWAAGVAAADAGDTERSLRHLEAAAAACAEHGLVPMGRRVQQSLRRLGRRTPVPRSSGSGPQTEVLRRVARGYTSGQIARSLALKPSTVETHIRNAMRDTGASTRLHAAALLLPSEVRPDPDARPNVVGRDPDALAAVATHARTAGLGTSGLGDVPTEPWKLDGLVVTGVVRSRDDAARAVLAAVRGARIAVCLPDDARTTAFLIDGLRRVGPLECVAGLDRATERSSLSDLELRLLELLAAGNTIAEAAATVGYSRRTIERRLVEARRRLGVGSNAEALLVAGFIAPVG